MWSAVDNVLKFFQTSPKNVDKAAFEKELTLLAKNMEEITVKIPEVKKIAKQYKSEVIIEVYMFMVFLIIFNVILYQHPSVTNYVILFLIVTGRSFLPFPGADDSTKMKIDALVRQGNVIHNQLAITKATPEALQAAGFTKEQIDASVETFKKADALVAEIDEINLTYESAKPSNMLIYTFGVIFGVSFLRAGIGLLYILERVDTIMRWSRF